MSDSEELDAANGGNLDRRDFLKLSLSAAAASGVGAGVPWAYPKAPGGIVVDSFERADSYHHGKGWESMNPGYWQVKNNTLRRRLKHRGDRRPDDWFPWHWETHRERPMPIDYDPSLPLGMVFRRDWKLSGNYVVRLHLTVRHVPKGLGQNARWKEHSSGYGFMGIAFGSNCLHESWSGGGKSGDAACMALWKDNGQLGIYDHSTNGPDPVTENAQTQGPQLEAGDQAVMELRVSGNDPEKAVVTAVISAKEKTYQVEFSGADRARFTNGYFGLVGRGLLDFEVNNVELEPGENQPLHVPSNELQMCYPLGDTLKETAKGWRCRFVTVFRTDGNETQLRIADTPDPPGGWANVPAAGRASVVTNEFRRNTAVIEAALPANPADATLYYTVWKDGENVTADPRIGTESTGPGTGFIGQVPSSGNYVGRLPRLKAPYRLCGLSCHAVTGGGPNLPNAGKYQEWWMHDQPTPEAYQHLEEYEFQVMQWEDDVWYLELIFPPPSVDDAYKVITNTLGGPTTRWQMMRHWNVINPGDHDHGMDDVKGPEQMIIRNVEGLGQDREYMRRNFQIVSHLIRGDENPSATDNPKRWRRWKMPNGDFSLLIVDGRLWRTSQDTNVWDDEGWGHKKNLYGRTNPTRALLGEEQFAWLQEIIRTDSAPLISITGINGLHTVWSGWKGNPKTSQQFNQRDRVAADYAGWVKAGADRVLELLGSRQGVVTVYGDVHLGCIMRNSEHRVYECAFGPIGRSGGRRPKDGFGPRMEDYDGRSLEVEAFYHHNYHSPELAEPKGPKYWNFLEMVFDPQGKEPAFELRIRNLVDEPGKKPQGGGSVAEKASNTGRLPASKLPPVKVLPNANVHLSRTNGQPVRGMQSLPDGRLPFEGLIGIAPGTKLLVQSHNKDQSNVKVVVSEPV